MVSDDRAQVLLLGGLAIAIVFLTAIPLSNSLVVSESASTSETVADIDRAAEREASVGRGLQAILRDADPNDPAALNRSLRNFSRYYTNVSGQQDGVYVNATVNVTASRGGVVNATGATNFEPYDGDSSYDNFEWDVVNDSTRISEFTMNLTDIKGGTNNGFRLTVNNSSGTQWQLRTHDSGGNVVQFRNGTGVWKSACPPGPTPIKLDIRNGECTVNASSPTSVTTQFPTYTATVEGPHNVHFDNGNRVSGSYRIAAIGEFPNGNVDFLVVPAVELSYVGPDTTYERTVLVNETS